MNTTNNCKNVKTGDIMETFDYCKTAAKAMEDKKAINIKLIDISEISIMADYFLICNGNNSNQVKAICDNIAEKLHELKYSPKQIEGYATANWILMDYGEIVIHIFDKESREFYDIERIWSDGKKITSF